MPLEYEMQYLYNITLNAISRYSEDHYCSSWYNNVENILLDHLLQGDRYALGYFNFYEISSMYALIKKGYWLKWKNDCVSLVRLHTVEDEIVWDDTKPIPNGAD